MIGNDTEEWKTVQDHHGESRKIGSTAKDIQSPIRIFADVPHIVNPNRRLRIYLGKILHQMIHSFETIYVCGCKKCTLNLHLFDNLSWGGTGHHRFFLKLSLYFERWLKKKIGLKISLGRTNAIADALKKSEAKNNISAQLLKKVDAKNKISDEELEKLHVHVRNVRDLVADPNSRHVSDTECCSEDETSEEDDIYEDDIYEDDSIEEISE